MVTSQTPVSVAPGQSQEQGPDLGAELAALADSGSLRNALVKAVKDAKDQWKIQAHFRNITIHAVSAIGTPGCLTGPDLEYLILQTPEVKSLSGLAEAVAEAVAEGVDEAFDRWRSKVTVPGLPWYPAFAAWPGPEAPPTPNVPFPLISCVSAQVTAITVPSNLKSAMYDALPEELKRPEIVPLLDQLATLLAAHFGPWLASQQVSLVMGRGPVPSFAPPFVPVGPVVNGSIIEAPRHLL
ncbi:MAG: hypothetical protein R3310_04430 [Candidatus Competibacteraceae bacterium]|nr:hypothetical protein [Candidatus Competibacteraceae bacterium]